MRRYITIVENAQGLPWVCGPDGQPLTVYHGTKTSRILDVSDGERDTIERFELETYFAADKAEARSYGDQIYAAHIWMRNPVRTNDYDYFAEAVHVIPDLEAEGHDGIIFGANEQFVVFSPDQVQIIGRE